jgi:hypothetical protein
MHEQSSRYQAYLQSPEWAQRKFDALRRAGQRCQVCNSPAALEVHHRTYERIYRELPEDLTVLCRECHARHHGTENTVEQQSPRETIRNEDLDAVRITGDTTAFAAKLDAILAFDPQFAALWVGAMTQPTFSGTQLRLCSLASGAMTDPELASLIRLHHLRHRGEGAASPPDDYIKRTIFLVRRRTDRDEQIQALRELGRRRP